MQIADVIETVLENCLSGASSTSSTTISTSSRCSCSTTRRCVQLADVTITENEHNPPPDIAPQSKSFPRQTPFLPRDAMHKRGLFRHAVPLCVCMCVSVTFVHCVKTNKDIFNFFSPSDSHSTKRDGNTPTGTPLTEASSAGRVG